MTEQPETLACEARSISVAFGPRSVLRNVSVAVPQGVVTGIVGPNGAGKSTLLRAMLGLVPTLSGSTQFLGTKLSRVRTQVAYMPQTSSVDWDFPTTALDIALMGCIGELGRFGRPTRVHRERAREALDRVGIADLAGRQIGELSGGQRQRVFLARSLVQDPQVYLMDEPFQGVDARTETAIMAVLHELRTQHRTVIMVHHDLATVPTYCDRVILLNGTVHADGSVATSFTREALRRTYEVNESADEFLEFLS